MKKQKQMLSASINDDEEDIFPSGEQIQTDSSLDQSQYEMMNRKREREETDPKAKKSKFEPTSLDPKPISPPIINNVINTNVVINPSIKTINMQPPNNYNYYNSNYHTNKLPFNNYNYYQPGQFGTQSIYELLQTIIIMACHKQEGWDIITTITTTCRQIWALTQTNME